MAPFHYYPQHDDNRDDTSHLKDSPFKMAVVGYGMPACILVVVVINFVIGTVYWPAGRYEVGDSFGGLMQSYPFGWRFAGVVTLKIGLAGVLFSWFALANYERTERWTHPALLASIIVIGLGFTGLAVGFLA